MVTVVPAERAFLFFDGTEYTFKIYGVNTDMQNYLTLAPDAEVTAVAKDGVLTFSHTFEGEQEQLIRMYKGEQMVTE